MTSLTMMRRKTRFELPQESPSPLQNQHYSRRRSNRHHRHHHRQRTKVEGWGCVVLGRQQKVTSEKISISRRGRGPLCDIPETP